MSSPSHHNGDSAEVLEAIRLLHERVSRIEAGAPDSLNGLPTNWNPFSGASKSELDRIATLELEMAKVRSSTPLLTALIGDIYRVLALIQAHVGMQPTQPPPYAPPAPQGFAPHPYAPQPQQYAPQPQQYAPQPQQYAPEYAPSAPESSGFPPAQARLHAKYTRFIQEAERMGRTS